MSKLCSFIILSLSLSLCGPSRREGHLSQVQLGDTCYPLGATFFILILNFLIKKCICTCIIYYMSLCLGRWIPPLWLFLIPNPLTLRLLYAIYLNKQISTV